MPGHRDDKRHGKARLPANNRFRWTNREIHTVEITLLIGGCGPFHKAKPPVCANDPLERIIYGTKKSRAVVRLFLCLLLEFTFQESENRPAESRGRTG